VSRRRKKKSLPPLPNPMVARAAKQALDKMLAEHTPADVTMNRNLLGGLLASVAARAVARLGEPLKVEIDGEEPITMTSADFETMALMSLGDFVTESVKTMDPSKVRRYGAEADAAAGVFGFAAGFAGPAAGMAGRAVETHGKKKKRPKKKRPKERKHRG
jgi:hypothetical protein